MGGDVQVDRWMMVDGSLGGNPQGERPETGPKR